MPEIGTETIVIPCFYLFALLDITSKNIVSLILLDGDFLNYDFELHKGAKYSNYTEYNHGPYGEGSIRHRKMYTYPNPLNAKISEFHLRQILVAKKTELEKIKEINETIRNLKHQNITVIIIAHRITTLENCKRIYEIKDGGLDGVYNYSELLNKKLNLENVK